MENNKFFTLAIESSCDETAAAVILNGRIVLSNIVSSQIDIHRQYGGVVPEIASRHHLANINDVVDMALTEAAVSMDDIDLIAVTHGPGLLGALVVGVATAKAIALATNKPIVAVNHMHGHIASNFITHQDLKPPFMCLVASGGHTDIVEVKSYVDFDVKGSTRDDAVGEAYDKVARVLNLEYPGGPKVDALAHIGNPNNVVFKRVLLDKNSYDFSFSGIKTAVLNYVNSCNQKNIPIVKEDIAAGFQEAVSDVIVTKAIHASKEFGYDTLAVAGGAASNSSIRSKLEEQCKQNGIKLYLPELKYCTDNAAMIGSIGYYMYAHNGESGLDFDAVSKLDY